MLPQVADEIKNSTGQSNLPSAGDQPEGDRRDSLPRTTLSAPANYLQPKSALMMSKKQQLHESWFNDNFK